MVLYYMDIISIINLYRHSFTFFTNLVLMSITNLAWLSGLHNNCFLKILKPFRH